MNANDIHELCLELPFTTESLQWGEVQVFKVGGKMFLCMNLSEESKYTVMFKCSEEDYFSLIENEGVFPAPYLARAHWIALESLNVIRPKNLADLIRKAYSIVFQKLPKKARKRR